MNIEIVANTQLRIEITKKALEETEMLLRNEMKYPEDLRRHDKVAYYKKHIDFLKGLLAQAQV